MNLTSMRKHGHDFVVTVLPLRIVANDRRVFGVEVSGCLQRLERVNREPRRVSDEPVVATEDKIAGAEAGRGEDVIHTLDFPR